MSRAVVAYSGFLFVGIFTPLPPAAAQTTLPATQPSNTDAAATSKPVDASPTTEPAKAKDASPSFFRLDYSGDWPYTPGMTGDWWGARSKLAEDGISVNVEVLQFLQGNAHGGKKTAVEYFGSADYILQFDTARMGLWPGGVFKLRGETPWGRGINRHVGAVSNPNYDTLFPEPDEPGLTTLTEAWYMQFLSDQLFVIAGKIDASRLPGQNVFASDYYTQFMNTSLWQNPVTFSTVPYTALAAGVGYAPTKWFDGATLVMDSHGTPTRAGFDTAMGPPSGVTILQTLAFHYKLFGLQGNSRFAASWSSRKRTKLEDLDLLVLANAAGPSFDRLDIPRSLVRNERIFRPGRFVARSVLSRVLQPEPESGNWMLTYDFDQYFYQEPEDHTQGIGVFGRFGWSPGDLNPVGAFYSIGIGGKGIIPTRDQDRFGAGYYYLDFSDDIPARLGIGSEQGVELYYNIEVFPWLHITPDIQIILDPGGQSGEKAAFVYGFRTQISF